MAVNLKQVEAQIRSLPAEDRARLAEVLLDSLRDPAIDDVEAAWAREIEARVQAYEKGEVDLFAAEDVFDEAKRLTE
jgi:putative addiction module component (TIGR02574 family)